MPYNSIISNSGQTFTVPAAGTAQPLIPLEYSKEIVKILPAESAVLTNCKHVNMGSSVTQMPVLDVLPEAKWLSNAGVATPGEPGEEGSYKAQAQTTTVGWKGVQLIAQAVATIAVIPKVTLMDSGYPIWEEVTPYIAAALGQKLDASALFGLESPFAAPALIPAALAAENIEVAGTHTKEEGSLANDISQLFSLVEAGSGFPSRLRSRAVRRRYSCAMRVPPSARS